MRPCLSVAAPVRSKPRRQYGNHSGEFAAANDSLSCSWQHRPFLALTSSLSYFPAPPSLRRNRSPPLFVSKFAAAAAAVSLPPGVLRRAAAVRRRHFIARKNKLRFQGEIGFTGCSVFPLNFVGKEENSTGIVKRRMID